MLLRLSFSFLLACLYGCHSHEPKVKLNVLAFGDSGSCLDPVSPETCKQNEIARSMQAVCGEYGCDMGIMLGDNIYEEGVESEFDDQFRYKYEFHYAPLAMPIYGAIGNHDLWLVDATEDEQIQAQVEYSKHSSTWRMDAEYYDYVQKGVHFFVINNVGFTAAQARWLSAALKESTAHWKVVYGHYPIHSNGYHGDTLALVDKLLPIVCEFADVYVSAHDHDLQLLDSDCGIPLVVSGASGKTRFSNTDINAPRRRWSVSETYGFARLEFNDQNFKVLYYGAQGELLYSRIYNRLYRLRLRGESTVQFNREGLYVEAAASAVRSKLKSGVLSSSTEVKQLNAVWALERNKKYIRIKNKLTGGYIHANNSTVEVAPQGTLNSIGSDIKTWYSAQWELVVPRVGIVFLKNRGRGKYLAVGADGKPLLTDSPSQEDSNWVLSPVDWTQYD